jgi:hypothetical protein
MSLHTSWKKIGGIMILLMATEIDESTIINNIALGGGGGGVYWYNTTDNDVIIKSRNEIRNNRARYGLNMATPAMSLSIVNASSSIYAYGQYASSRVPITPSLTVLLLDGYGSLIESSAIMTSLVASPSVSLSGPLLVDINKNGHTIFNGMSLHASSLPTIITITIAVERVTPEDRLVPDQLSTSLTFHLQSCPFGEWLDPLIKSCQSCPLGMNSTHFDLSLSSYILCVSTIGHYAVNSSVCLPCPLGTARGNLIPVNVTKLSLVPGRTNISDQCYACSIGSYSNVVGSVTCNECDIGFYTLLSSSTTCHRCGTYQHLCLQAVTD